MNDSNEEVLQQSSEGLPNHSIEEQYRVEIIGNMSVYQDLLDRIGEQWDTQYYSSILNTQGKGSSGSRTGDSTWPEENFIFIAYCQESHIPVIKNIVKEIKQLFTHEGIKMFAFKLQNVVIL